LTGEAKHTVSAFDDDLDALRGNILELGSLASRAVRKSVRALEKRDVDLAKQIVLDDKAIDALDAQTESDAVNIIALRAPMADDLRTIVAAIKISSLLERTADYARNIARRIPDVADQFPEDLWLIASAMTDHASTMLVDAVQAYAKNDLELADAVIAHDDIVDDLHDELTAKLIEFMISKPTRISQAAQLLFVGKHLERIGDQATNIAEMVTYAVTGAQPKARESASDLVSA
jgi:phosphate transport system protein